MKLNITQKSEPIFTAEGGKAVHITPTQQLRRSVMSCLLWEDEFYESGEDITTRIKNLVQVVPPVEVARMAIEARTSQHLRHVPLLLMASLAGVAGGTSLVSDTLAQVIQRADELAEFLAIYAKVNGVEPKNLKSKLSNQVRKGLAKAFVKFNAYSLAKYNRDGVITLRDVLFLCHAKPLNAEQAAVWAKLIDNTLESPDTWEVQLSAGADKKETFERLIREGKLGYLALLRNLRNMTQAGCDFQLVRDAIIARQNGAEKVLPFRYIAAANAAPQFANELNVSLLQTVADSPELKGETVILVDNSGSMYQKLSQKSDLERIDAAAALASIIRGNRRVFSFAWGMEEVAPYPGLAGVTAIKNTPSGGTRLFESIEQINSTIPYERIIVITDEQAFGYGQSGCPKPLPGTKGYMINVASAKNGVGYGEWNHIDGFSENVIRWILALEEETAGGTV